MKKYLAKGIAADPTLSPDERYTGAVEQVGSGSTIPEIAKLTTPLVKIVPIIEKEVSELFAVSLKRWMN